MQTLASAGRAEASVYDLWYVPGKPVSIHLSREASADILRHAPAGWFRRRKEESGGVLFGAVERERGFSTIRIHEALDVPSEHLFGPGYALSETDKQAFRELLARPRDHGLQPVGLYRTQARKGLALDPEDLQSFSELLPDADRVVLLVKRRRIRASRAAFFIREEGRVQSESSYLEFPVSTRRRKPFVAPGLRARFVRVEANAPKPRAPLWSSWWVQAPLLLALLCADGLLGFFSARQWNRIVPPATEVRDPYALSLMVLEYADNLHLTWDHKALPVAAAERGLLLITDGGQDRTMDLSREQLQNGSVVYRKMSNDVHLRLEVFLKGRRSVTEAWSSTGASPWPPELDAGQSAAAGTPAARPRP